LHRIIAIQCNIVQYQLQNVRIQPALTIEILKKKVKREKPAPTACTRATTYTTHFSRGCK